MTATRSGGAATSRLNAKVVGISVAAALGGFLFGFDTSVLSLIHISEPTRRS